MECIEKLLIIIFKFYVNKISENCNLRISYTIKEGSKYLPITSYEFLQRTSSISGTLKYPTLLILDTASCKC